MSAFPDWKKFIVKQKRQKTGCIPWSYEIILRSAGEKRVNFLTFQDEFDLDKDIKWGEVPTNHFVSVAKEIKKKYPFINFTCTPYDTGKGNEKLKTIEEFIDKKRPVLVSIANAYYGRNGWHIMPVVDATDDTLVLLESVDDSGRPKTMTLTKNDLVCIHDNFDGGKEIAFLDEEK